MTKEEAIEYLLPIYFSTNNKDLVYALAIAISGLTADVSRNTSQKNKIVPLTNADHLQELSDEEKAHLLTQVFYRAAQQTNAEHYILEWLKKPVGKDEL